MLCLYHNWFPVFSPNNWLLMQNIVCRLNCVQLVYLKPSKIQLWKNFVLYYNDLTQAKVTTSYENPSTNHYIWINFENKFLMKIIICHILKYEFFLYVGFLLNSIITTLEFTEIHPLKKNNKHEFMYLLWC